MRADVKSLLFDGFLLLLQMTRIVHSNKTKIFPILRRKKREQLLQKRKNCPRKTKVQLPLRLRRRKKEKKKGATIMLRLTMWKTKKRKGSRRKIKKKKRETEKKRKKDKKF